ncbi:MAG: diacylglycerol kinase [Gammaproteobacteria bacterium]|nr:diacylglycerol kinase [Gammaproteobacteria bacterium]MDH5692909.1 diacylglycerol kinase [Gammaproteobacteria bacterium]
MKNQGFLKRFQFALRGIGLAARTERSVQTQLVFATLICLVLIYLQVNAIWWAILILTIALVLSIELINTAIEAVCDLVEPDHHPQIEKIKDIAAGAVLLASIASCLIALSFVIYLVKG